ncbi:MAG: cysteine desulfurase [Deltaproteobacteria bacterium]|nr:MAG: cysteine desulfurase [Deltaproteobacteria bacterium]
MSRLDVGRVRKDFPVLEREVHGKPLAYLDNAATSQKPRAVIDALIHYYSSYNANIHRGVHSLSEEATVAYEAARDKVRDFIRAPSSEEIVFTRGTTEAINLVAQSYLRPRIREGDEILISQMEHHSNIVPWQLVREQTGAVLKVAPINERGEIELEQFSNLLGPRTRFVALAHVSNALGTINMVQEMVRLARMRGVPVLLDGAQAVPHLPVDVQELGCDFYAFSGHKMYAPTGIGALYGRRELLEEMEPYQGGGEMILSVTFEKTTYNRVPYKFEAGTPNIAGAIGLGTAIDYLLGLDLQAVRAHEDELLEYATKEVSKIPSVRLIGTAASKTGVLSFLLGEIHAHDVGTVLDQEGIAVRTGHHCAQPVMDRFGVTATARASFAVYNTTEEVDRLVEGLHRTLEIFS